CVVALRRGCDNHHFASQNAFFLGANAWTADHTALQQEKTRRRADPTAKRDRRNALTGPGEGTADKRQAFMNIRRRLYRFGEESMVFRWNRFWPGVLNQPGFAGLGD